MTLKEWHCSERGPQVRTNGTHGILPLLCSRCNPISPTPRSWTRSETVGMGVGGRDRDSEQVIKEQDGRIQSQLNWGRETERDRVQSVVIVNNKRDISSLLWFFQCEFISCIHRQQEQKLETPHYLLLLTQQRLRRANKPPSSAILNKLHKPVKLLNPLLQSNTEGFPLLTPAKQKLPLRWSSLRN